MVVKRPDATEGAGEGGAINLGRGRRISVVVNSMISFISLIPFCAKTSSKREGGGEFPTLVDLLFSVGFFSLSTQQ